MRDEAFGYSDVQIYYSGCWEIWSIKYITDDRMSAGSNDNFLLQYFLWDHSIAEVDYYSAIDFCALSTYLFKNDNKNEHKWIITHSDNLTNRSRIKILCI